MNVNLNPVSDSSKATTSTSQSKDTEQSEGFFSKLAAFIKGEASEEISTDKVATESLTEGEGSTKVMLEQQVNLEGELGDEEPVTLDKSSASVTELKGEDIKTDAVASPVASSKMLATEVIADVPDGDAEKIVSENGALLGRLNEANKALQPKDGNGLPLMVNKVRPISNDMVEKIHPGLDTEVVQQALSEGDVVTKEVTDPANAKRILLQNGVSERQSIVIPETAQQFIEPEELVTDLPMNSGINYHTPLAINTVVSANAVEPNEVELAINADIEKLKLQLKAQGVTGIELEQIVEAAKNKAMLESVPTPITPIAKAVNTELRKLSSAQQNNTTNDASINSKVNLNTSLDPLAATSASVIPWSASIDEITVDEMPLKVEAKYKAQHTHLAQTVPQALNQSVISNQQTSQAVANMPLVNDFPVNPLQHAAAAAPIVSEQAMLKAVIGAKAAGSLGKLANAASKQGASQSQELGLAQQLSQAVGQQSNNTHTQIRSDQASAQTPMPLNREVAGEQVAERVQMMMSKNLKSVDIRLDPPELGRLQIRLNMGGDGATVHFTVANQQARDVIEQSMPRLREMLSQQGVQLGDSSVQQQSSGQQQNRYAGNGPDNGQGNGNQPFAGDENLEPDVNLDLNVITKRDGISYYA